MNLCFACYWLCHLGQLDFVCHNFLLCETKGLCEDQIKWCLQKCVAQDLAYSRCSKKVPDCPLSHEPLWFLPWEIVWHDGKSMGFGIWRDVSSMLIWLPNCCETLRKTGILLNPLLVGQASGGCKWSKCQESGWHTAGPPQCCPFSPLLYCWVTCDHRVWQRNMDPLTW